MYRNTNSVVLYSIESDMDYISEYNFDHKILARNIGYKVSGSIILSFLA